MSKWTLKIANIGGFKDKKEFLINEGLNLVVGDNATGKTTLINSFKLLNKLNLNIVQNDDEKHNSNLTYKDFLNDKTKSGRIKLINEHHNYERNITSPVVDITSFIKGKSVSTKQKVQNLISYNPNVIKFAYIDKNNELMESIEYSGTIERIKNEIVKISNIKNHELILKQVKKLNFEYNERKEEGLKKYNDERKEIELKIREHLNISKDLVKNLNQIQIDEEVSAELNQLKVELESKNSKYNTLRLRELDSLNKELNKKLATIDKDRKKIESAIKKKSEFDDFLKLERSIEENEKKIQSFDIKIKELEEEKHGLNITKRIADNQIRLLQETLNNNQETELCQHCLSPINSRKIKKKIEELSSTKNEFNINLRDLQSKFQLINKKRNKLNELILNQKNLPKKIKDLTSDMNNLEKKIETNQIKKDKLEKEITITKKELAKIQNDINRIQEKIISIANQDDTVKEKHTELITKLNLIKEEIENLSIKKGLLVQKILILPENYNKLIKRTEEFINNLNKTIEAFYLEFVDYLNSQLKILLEKLNWKFQEVYIDDDLSLVIMDPNGKPQKFHSLSEFEKKSIAILILLIIKMKYFPEYPIVAIDEHLNSADPQRFLSFVPYLYENIMKSNVKFMIITLLPSDLEEKYLKDLEMNQYEHLTIYSKN